MESEIQSLYLRYFGRPADYSGIDFWQKSLRAGATINQIKAGFEASPEFLGLYSNRSPERVVERAYDYLFGRLPDSGGLLFWADHLRSGRLSLNTILDTIINSAVFSDKITLQSRTQAASSFTNVLREKGVAFATQSEQETGRRWLSQINAKPISRELAIEQLPVLIPRLTGAEPGLVDERVASAFTSMLASLGNSPTLRVFYDMTGSGTTRLNQPLQSIPINDEIIGLLRLTIDRVDALVSRFQIVETTSIEAADIEVHVVQSFPGDISGSSTSLIQTTTATGAKQIYSRIDLLPKTGADASFLVGHEVLHAFGGEHPFDSSDGDALAGVTTSDTLLSYQQSSLAVQNGYASVFTPLDEAVLRSIFST